MTNSISLLTPEKPEKAVFRFEKSKEASTYTNEDILALFHQAFLSIPNWNISNRLSLASSNQTHGIILGVDYLFFDIEKGSLVNSSTLVQAINASLQGKLHVTDLVNIDTFASPHINKFAYYVADLSRLPLPEEFSDNLTLLVTRDTDANGEFISVTETTYRVKGNRKNPVLRTYHLLELVPHIHYVPEEKKLYFIADGNVSAFILLAGLLYGKGVYSEDFLPKVTLFRLDYLDSRQKIQHCLRAYDSILGEYVSLNLDE